MFGTSGVRGAVGTAITADLALSVGRALAADGYERVVCGRDARASGEMLEDAVSVGLRECGADVIRVGVASTPAIARAVEWLKADAGIVITASHNPPEDNGIKLWTDTGQAFGTSRRASISERVQNEAYELAPWDRIGMQSTVEDIVDRHEEALTEAVSLDTPLSVVVDVGNGTGGVTASVLHRLGCHVRTLNGQPDGHFPGRPSEPTEETLETLLSVVKVTDADFGVAHDGDADRMMAVDETGRFVPKDALFSLLAQAVAGDGDRVAAPVDTSLAVDDALAAVGASVIRTPVGDVYIAEAATEPDVVFGGEPSGAWIWPAETLCPDGPLAACKLAEIVSSRGPLSALIDTIDRYPIVRDSLEVADNEAVLERVRETVVAREDDHDTWSVDTLDGVRVDVGDGWFLIRASGTQPLVRLTAEARESKRAEELLETAAGIVSEALESV